MPTLKEAQEKVRDLSAKGLEITRSSMTAAEMKAALDPLDEDLNKWMDEVKSLQFVEERRKSFMAQAGTPVEDVAADAGAQTATAKSIGQQFVESNGYKSLRSLHSKSSAWSTGAVELKTLLTEAGGGAATVATPTVLPGVVDIRFQPLTIADLFPNGTTNTPLIRYLVESGATNPNQTVVEGALKPEAALAFTKVDETLHKIANFLPVTDEMLEDFDQIRSYIDNRLSLFVRQTEEAQLLSGDGTGANLVGLLNRAGIATAIVKGTAPSIAGDNDMDAILRQITAIRTTSWLEPDAIVVNPQVWQTIQLSKATGTGNYFAGGPFLDTVNQTLWGKKVVVTNAAASGTAIVGSFAQGGQIFRKGGLTVEASNSHADYFQRNQTAIRAETRLALAIYRPSAFGVVSNL